MKTVANSKKEERLLKTLEAINSYKNNNHGTSPTVRELCVMVGVSSTSTMHGYVQTLIKRGLIGNKAKSPRTIIINDTRKEY